VTQDQFGKHDPQTQFESPEEQQSEQIPHPGTNRGSCAADEVAVLRCCTPHLYRGRRIVGAPHREAGLGNDFASSGLGICLVVGAHRAPTL